MNRIVVGELCFYRRPEVKPRKLLSRRSVEKELERFSRAQEQAVRELNDFHDRACLQVGERTASIFSIHAMLLEDEDFVDAEDGWIRDKGLTAEYAVWTTGMDFAGRFAGMDSPYMQARAADMKDISWRVIRRLTGRRWEFPLASPVLLVSDEFLPSEVMELSQRQLLGLVSRQGSVDSHTAALLRSYRIPAMAEVDIPAEWEGHTALMDGGGGRLYLDPDLELLNSLLNRGSPADRELTYFSH